MSRWSASAEVELVGFHGEPPAGTVYEIAVEIFRYAAEERAAASAGHVIQPCGEGGGGGLSVRSRHGHDILICGQYAEDFRAFQHTEAAAAEPGRFGVVVGDGGRIDDERVVRIAERGGDAGRAYPPTRTPSSR